MRPGLDEALNRNGAGGLPPPADRIGADELAYHRKVVRQFVAAQDVMNSWGAHLGERYGLRPGVDRLLEDGAIERAGTIAGAGPGVTFADAAADVPETSEETVDG